MSSARSAKGRGLQYPSRAPLILERGSSSSPWRSLLRGSSSCSARGRQKGRRPRLQVKALVARRGSSLGVRFSGRQRRPRLVVALVARRGLSYVGEPFSQAPLGFPGIAENQGGCH